MTVEMRDVFAMVLIAGIALVGNESQHQDNTPPSFGQDIGGGIHTTCHGTDRMNTSSTGLAVIRNDTSCDSGG